MHQCLASVFTARAVRKRRARDIWLRRGLPICIAVLIWLLRIAHNSAVPWRFLSCKQFVADEAFANVPSHNQEWFSYPVVCGECTGSILLDFIHKTPFSLRPQSE